MKSLGWQLTGALIILFAASAHTLLANDGLPSLAPGSHRLSEASLANAERAAVVAGPRLNAHSAVVGRIEMFPFPDMGPVSIDEPWDTVWCYDTVLVAATICNFGDTSEPFEVEALIDTSGVVVYADTELVVGLGPGNCTSVEFADWVVPEVYLIGSCDVRVTTLLASDVNPSNDTLSKTITIWCAAYHDVLVDYIDEPWDTVWCGDTSAVIAWVCNYGDSVESFDVEAVIDLSGFPVYVDTQSVANLEPDSCVSVNFANWPVPGGHLVSYTTTVTALLAGDMDPTNDTLRTTSVNWCPTWRDVSLDSISAPPDTVLCDSIVHVVAAVCNFGETIETFDVEAVVVDTSGLPVYTDTATVAGLLPDSCVSVSFADWVVPSLDSVSYDVTIATLLPEDEDGSNDSASKTVFCWCWQPGVYEALGPAGLPTAFSLGAPSPNPTRGESRIEYSLPASSSVTLRVYDVRGRMVKSLIDGFVPAGLVTAQWDGVDNAGRPAPSGIYFYEFSALPELPGYTPYRSSGKLLLLR
jgi:hypothetical protein